MRFVRYLRGGFIFRSRGPLLKVHHGHTVTVTVTVTSISRA